MVPAFLDDEVAQVTGGVDEIGALLRWREEIPDLLNTQSRARV